MAGVQKRYYRNGAPTQEKYKELRRRGGRAVAEAITILETIEIKKESLSWDNHLFVDKNGEFGWKAGGWERSVLQTEMQRPDFAGFLRNIPRGKGSLCVPYGAENDQSFFPDLLTFRRHKKGVWIDILEPHGDQFADHLPKAQGLAHYAREHGEGFGRIEMIRLVKGKPERLDMQEERCRSKVLKATTAEQLEDLYEEHG